MNRIVRAARKRLNQPATRRGQAMVEFAMVAPILFMIMFGFFYLGAQAFNIQSMRHAAEVGTDRMNDEMQPITLVFANDPRTSVAFLGWNSGAVNNTCRQAANRYNANGEYRRRLGWDWNCGISFSIPGMGNRTSLSALSTAMQRAANESWARINAPGFFIGNPRNVTIEVCLAVLNNNGTSSCAYTLRRAPSGVFSTVAGPPNPRTAPAPSFIQISLRSPGPFTLFGMTPGTSQAQAMRQLDRFLPACPAERVVPSGNRFSPNHCGGQG